VDMYAGVFFIQIATGLDMYLAMIPLLAVTAVYTVVGGLAAVVLTDTLQTLVMLIGAVVMAVISFLEVGGMSALYDKYMDAVAQPLNTSTSISSSGSQVVGTKSSSVYSFFNDTISGNDTMISGNDTCGQPRDDAFHMFRDPLNSDLPWPGVVFRATFASLWNWCADQVIVQRALAAKNMGHARGATILAGYLKFTPLFLIIFPGMISRVLYPDVVACVGKEACEQACGNKAGCSNTAYPYLIMNLAPRGIRGLLMAVMVAALMSSLTSIFNSAVTVFTMDLWTRGRPRATERELLLVGRAFVVVLVGLSILWIPLIMQSQGGQLFMYIQAVTGYIAPPISAIFILAVTVPRINEKGAFWGVVCGQIVGITRLVLDFVYPKPPCGEDDDRPTFVSKVHFTYFSVVVFGITAVVALVVSFLTKPQEGEEIENLTFWTLKKKQKRTDEYQTTVDPLPPTWIAMLTKNEEFIKSNNWQSDTEEDEKISQSGEDINRNNSPYAKFKTTVDRPWSLVLNANCIILVAALVGLCVYYR
ncbi:sodium/glucose cotransporter 4, partial [Elysia marginata]